MTILDFFQLSLVIHYFAAGHIYPIFKFRPYKDNFSSSRDVLSKVNLKFSEVLSLLYSTYFCRSNFLDKYMHIPRCVFVDTFYGSSLSFIDLILGALEKLCLMIAANFNIKKVWKMHFNLTDM